MIQREYLLTICKAAGLKYAGTGAVPKASPAGGRVRRVEPSCHRRSGCLRGTSP